MHTIGPINGLGTTWWVELFDVPNEAIVGVENVLRTSIQTFESQYSRFIDTSLIGRLNNGETISEPPKELLTLLQLGISWFDATHGHLNFMSGHLQEAQGYDKQYSFIKRSDDQLAYNPHQALVLSADVVRVENGKIDLGAYGKGFLIDAIASTLKNVFGVQKFLINGGGDMYAASHEEPIEVAIEHPTQPGMYIAKVPLKDHGLAVSSSYKRQWKDRLTGTPQDHFLHLANTTHQTAGSSYVIARSAMAADVLATVSHVVPPSIAETLLRTEAVAYARWPDGGSLQVSKKFAEYILAHN